MWGTGKRASTPSFQVGKAASLSVCPSAYVYVCVLQSSEILYILFYHFHFQTGMYYSNQHIQRVTWDPHSNHQVTSSIPDFWTGHKHLLWTQHSARGYSDTKWIKCNSGHWKVYNIEIRNLAWRAHGRLPVGGGLTEERKETTVN